MYNILTLNKISKIGLSSFSSDYLCSDKIKNPDAILVRSASLHELEFNNNLIAIARAGAGVNNIPIDKCTKNGIIVFNTPGANSNAVKELVIASLFLASRKITEGIEFCKTINTDDKNISMIIEKEKSKFKGPEIKNKKLGIIGLGAIGKLVANTACDLSMDVYGYDPYISSSESEALISNNVKIIDSLDKILSICDYISLHIPLNQSTKNFINEDNISKMKSNVKILNFSRGDLVNSNDIIKAVKLNQVSCYITDFPTNDMININGIIPIPHLGASTPESEDNCSIMAVTELIDYIENGNITNSVNMHNISIQRGNGTRICIIHKYDKNIVDSILSTISNKGFDIANIQSKSKNNYSYTIIDLKDRIDSSKLNIQDNINGIIKIRILNK